MPNESTYRELKQAIDQIRMVDAHTHLEPYHCLQGKMDLFRLFLLHSSSSLLSAGMPQDAFDRVNSRDVTAEEKWPLFAPYWERLSNTAYCRLFEKALGAIYGIGEVNEETYQALDQKIRQAYRDNPGHYSRVLGELAGIEKAVWDYGVSETDDAYFAPAYRFENKRPPAWDHFITVRSREELEAIEQHYDRGILCFDDFLALYEEVFADKIRGGVCAIKTLLAYLRTLDFELVTKNEAERVFNSIFTRIKPNPGFLENQNEGPAWAETKLLQDYMVHKTLALASHHKVPMQIHAGFQLGRRTVAAYGDPKLLNHLFIHYRDLQFVIMHTAIPFSRELGAMAKNFANVAIDFSWTYTLCPTATRRFLGEMLEFLPVHKMMGFGSDNATAEGVLGEALAAREATARVLAEKVDEGYFSLTAAQTIAAKLLRQNAIDIFHLNMPS